MKKNKNQKVFIFLVLLLAISVGYALIATTLKINGSSSVKSARWNVYWDNLQVKEGSSPIHGNSATRIVDYYKTIVEYDIELSEPGDFYEFSVDAVNDGSLDAMIETITDSGLTARQKEYINYSVKYKDGSEVKVNDKLTAHTRDTYVVRLEYRTDIEPSKLPEGTETIDLTFEIKYVQANNNAVVRPRSCNQYLYAEGDISTSQYNTICGDYIDESIYTYEDNGDGTVKLTGLVSGATLNPKVFALPTSIDGKTVTKVAGDAFDSKITSEVLVISPTITTIEDLLKDDEENPYYSFGNNSFKGVAIPNSVTYIGEGAFYHNTNLTFANVGKGITIVKAGTFAKCTSLTKVVLNDDITTIEPGAFADAGLTSIDFPKKVTRIDGGTFSNVKMEKLVIPDTITTLNSGAFSNAEIKEFYTGNGVTELNYGLFNTSEVRKFVIGDSITEIKHGYFSSNTPSPKLEEVVIGKNVTSIGYSAFATANLTKITIPEKVTQIYQGALMKSDTSNPNLNKVINKTGKAFNWYDILSAPVTGEYEVTFVTGTVHTPYGDVQITAE